MKTRTLAASSFSLHLKLFFVAALFCALTLALAPAPVQAAGLSTPQIEAVLGLLEAFNVPQETIKNVRGILYGESAMRVPAPMQMRTKPIAYVPAQVWAPAAPAPQPAERARAAARSFVPASSGSSLVASAAMVPILTTTDSLNLVADQIIEVNTALAYVLSAYIELFSMKPIPLAAAAATAPQAPMPAAGESFALTLAYMPQSLYETVGDTTDFMAAVEMAPVYVITDALTDALFKAGLY